MASDMIGGYKLLYDKEHITANDCGVFIDYLKSDEGFLEFQIKEQ